jgi:hypothetical protein
VGVLLPKAGFYSSYDYLIFFAESSDGVLGLPLDVIPRFLPILPLILLFKSPFSSSGIWPKILLIFLLTAEIGV